MASMSLPKTLVFNFSRVFPQSPPSFLLHAKVSRVCFTSASKYSQGQNAGGGREGNHSKAPWTSSSDSDSDAEEKVHEMKDKAKEKMKETSDRTREGSVEMKERAKETAENMAEKTKDTTGKAASKAKEHANNTKEKAKEHAYNMKDKTQGAAEMAAEKAKEGTHKTSEAAGTVGKKAKEGGYKVEEGAYKAGETVAEKAKEGTSKAAGVVKQAVEGVWEVAKGTGHKIKETVVGKSGDEDVDDYIEDHVRRPPQEEEGLHDGEKGQGHEAKKKY